MKGLELSEKFYREFGAPMIREQFPHLEGIVAAALVGSGSECLGYDDEISRDHDFDPGFCILIPGKELVDEKTEFALSRAYSKLPRSFGGYERSLLAPVGGSRRGVMRISAFLYEKTGNENGLLSTREWFSAPEQSLLEATSGRVFRDDLGVFSKARSALEYLPEDVRLKKLAGELLIMGQSGQYNYARCFARGEYAAAQLAIGEFVKSALHAVFLINRRYLPYYKWSFRAMRELEKLSFLSGDLEYLLTSPNNEDEYAKKRDAVERICLSIADLLRIEKSSDYPKSELEGHAYSVNDRIKDPNVRNLHILYAV